MKIKSQQDFWAGLMFIAIGLGFAWYAGSVLRNAGSASSHVVEDERDC